MIIKHEKKLSALELTQAQIQYCVMKQEPWHQNLYIELEKRDGLYHVRCRDTELHGNVGWHEYDTLTAARSKFAELKRDIRDSMKKKVFNLTGE